MKKATKLVWTLENGNTIIGCSYSWKTGNAYKFFVQITGVVECNDLNLPIMEYTKDEMVEIYGLTDDDFADIDHNHF